MKHINSLSLVAIMIAMGAAFIVKANSDFYDAYIKSGNNCIEANRPVYCGTEGTHICTVGTTTYFQDIGCNTPYRYTPTP